MGVNVVNYGGKTLVDMRNATATASTVLAGYTAYGADGNLSFSCTYLPLEDVVANVLILT